ncbi:MAG: hypothetical protein HY351_04910, partial [Candidatus Omnitrophica bacterium]|nr:hypothetical protein [Candidatus Omnitrophota bacterium]
MKAGYSVVDQLQNQLKKRASFLNKSIAIIVLISFTLLNTSYNSIGYAEPPLGSNHPHHGISQVDPMTLIGTLKLPEELGSIQETYMPQDLVAAKPDKFVIYLQSAHTNYDSESNTKKLIQFFQNEYGLPLVLLEGGEGRLDSLFFKSFPDQDLKRKILEGYAERGELSGGEIASILDDQHDTRYFGIEDQALYDENKTAFLSAMGKENEILNVLNQIERELAERSKIELNENSKVFLNQRKAFEREEIDLMEYVKELKTLFEKAGAGLPRPLKGKGEAASLLQSVSLGNVSIEKGTFKTFSSQFPELHKIITAQTHETRFKGENFDAAMTQMIQAFQAKILPKLPKAKQMEINQMIQMQKIGHLSEGMLVKQIEDLSREMNFFFEVPQA